MIINNRRVGLTGRLNRKEREEASGRRAILSQHHEEVFAEAAMQWWYVFFHKQTPAHQRARGRGEESDSKQQRAPFSFNHSCLITFFFLWRLVSSVSVMIITWI